MSFKEAIQYIFTGKPISKLPHSYIYGVDSPRNNRAEGSVLEDLSAFETDTQSEETLPVENPPQSHS